MVRGWIVLESIVAITSTDKTPSYLRLHIIVSKDVYEFLHYLEGTTVYRDITS